MGLTKIGLAIWTPGRVSVLAHRTDMGTHHPRPCLHLSSETRAPYRGLCALREGVLLQMHRELSPRLYKTCIGAIRGLYFNHVNGSCGYACSCCTAQHVGPASSCLELVLLMHESYELVIYHTSA